MKFYFYNLRLKSKLKIRILAFLAVFLVIFILLFRDNNKKLDIETFNPIQNVATTQEIYSITASLDSSVQLKDFRTFLEVANGLNAKLTFFVSEDFFSSNVETIKKILSFSHEVGFFIEKDVATLSRNETMRYLAKLNDSFFNKCGKYPKYIRYKSGSLKAGYLFEVLAAFGQYSIADERSTKPAAGMIVDLGKIDATSGSKLIGVVTEAVQAKLTTVPLKDLLFSVDVPADANGTQGAR